MRDRVLVDEGGMECNWWAWIWAGGLKATALLTSDAAAAEVYGVEVEAAFGAAGMRMNGVRGPAIIKERVFGKAGGTLSGGNGNGEGVFL
jgi:hypothetical protein